MVRKDGPVGIYGVANGKDTEDIVDLPKGTRLRIRLGQAGHRRAEAVHTDEAIARSFHELLTAGPGCFPVKRA